MNSLWVPARRTGAGTGRLAVEPSPAEHAPLTQVGIDIARGALAHPRTRHLRLHQATPSLERGDAFVGHRFDSARVWSAGLPRPLPNTELRELRKLRELCAGDLRLMRQVRHCV